MLPGINKPGSETRAGRAQPPRPPALSRGALEAERHSERYLRERETRESRSIFRGLLLLAVLVLIVTLALVGVERAFFPGWWRHW